jgi:uncharacterized OB-fold protein
MIKDRPPLTGPDAAEFWAGCDEGVLRFQRCASCAQVNWFPRTFCRFCSSTDLPWEEGAGIGTVVESTLVHRPLNESFKDEVPYVLAIVHLDEGYDMLTRIVGEGFAQSQPGDRVSVTFAPTTGHPLPVFELIVD